ncbi:MAG: TlpA family protein disulfide reductase, partial [Pyrinomonadaceae bacterium]
NKPLPNLVLNTIDGKKWELYENRGQIVLLNFWATWCVPCKSEIPALVRLAEKHRADGLKVAGISVDSENTPQIKKFIESYKIKYPILLTVPDSLLSQQKAIPMSLLIDEKGFLAKKYIGAIKEDVFEKDIKDLLHKKSASQKSLR